MSSRPACTSASIEPSHVLIAKGLSENGAFNCLRFGIGTITNYEDIPLTINSVYNSNNKINQLV